MTHATQAAAGGPSTPPSEWTRTSRIGLCVVAVAALAVRIQNVAINKTHAKLYGDAFDYFMQGKNLAAGNGYVQTLGTFRMNSDLPSGTLVPTAAHPPGFTTFLALLQRLGLTTPLQQRYALCVVGALTVVVIFLIVRRLLGDRPAIIAGLIGAGYPNLWINSGLLMSETLFVAGFALGLYGSYAFYQEHRRRFLIIASIGFTIAMSTRPEQVLCFPLILVPLVLARRSLPWRSRLGHLGIAAIFPLLVLVPWTIYNATRFSEPVLFTTGSGQTLLQGNCVSTYSGKLLGSYDYHCMLYHPPKAPAPGQIPDESVQDAHYRSLAFEYMKYHRWEFPKVAAAREGRLWGVYRTGQQNIVDHFIERRGPLPLIQWTQRVYWVLALLALVGIWRFRRRRILLYPMLAEVGITAFVTAFTFGNTRYRAGVEVCIVILAAAAIDWCWQRITARRARRLEEPEPPPQPASVDSTT